MSKKINSIVLVVGCAVFVGLLGMRGVGEHLRRSATDLLWSKKHERAHDLFRLASRIDPLDSAGLVGQADSLLDRVDRPWLATPDQIEPLDIAIGLYHRVLQGNPGNPNVWLQLARSYKLKSVARQVSMLRDVSNLGEEIPPPMEHGLAQKAVERAIALDPSNYIYLDYLAELQYGFERAASLNSYRQSLRVLPRLEGHAYLDRPSALPEDIAEAVVRGARAALGTGNMVRDFKILDDLAIFHAKRGEFLIAADVCLEAIAAGEPEAAILWTLRGDWLDRAGDAQGAREGFLQALALEPDRAIALSGLGRIAAREERFEEALQRYRAARSSEPRNPRYHLELARALEKTGELEKAAESYLAVLRLGGETVAATGLVRVYREQKLYDKALVYAKRLADSHPGEVSFQRQVQELESHLAF